MENNLLNKLRKIRELAEHGIGGEKTNAIRKLKQLLKKHGLEYEDVFKEEPDKTWAIFPYSDKQQRIILLQCLFKLKATSKDLTYKQITDSKIAFFLTSWETLELTHLYSYYRKLWKKQLDDVLTAFVSLHELVSGEGLGTGEDMTQDELEKFVNLARGMRDSEYKSTRTMLDTGLGNDLDEEM